MYILFLMATRGDGKDAAAFGVIATWDRNGAAVRFWEFLRSGICGRITI